MDTLTKTSSKLLPPCGDITPAELADFQSECRRIMALGGEEGAIAADMLRIGDRLTAMHDEIARFLAS